MNPYRIIGIESSPYAVKVRAVMRYRRIAHIWVARMPQFLAETADVKPLIMPVIQFPGGEYKTDSTPIIQELERLHADRSVTPEQRTAAFCSMLLEDMADEWLTKCLFHYRFNHDLDARYGAHWVMDDAHPNTDSAELDDITRSFIDRQQSRRDMVGCGPNNAGLLETFLRDVLDVMESFVATDRYLFGTRPSAADFAIYGQLSTISRDPSGYALLSEHYPRTLHWTRRVDDLSGVEGRWFDTDEPISAAARKLLSLSVKYYLPFLVANHDAVGAGDSELAVEICGSTYRQPPYRYNRKCWNVLVGAYSGLDPSDRAELDDYLGADGAQYFALASDGSI